MSDSRCAALRISSYMELDDLCITAKNLYFFRHGASNRQASHATYKPLQRPTSDIYSLPVNEASG